MKQERGGSVTDSRFSGLPRRPGKIVAVHLSYGSRADHRGRRTAAPSYFFKASGSVAASGSGLGRPAGIELLAFAGEVALVIAWTAYRVTLAQAWDHVAYVTASNDFGMYDLRGNDRGSNVRNKSGDGFTPIGPALIDAREIDPAKLRVRTWVNGELAQDGEPSDLIFPLAQSVADLCKHFTLDTAYIDAREIDLEKLRVRTWVKEELAHDGETSDLIFPLAQFVADLPQHFSLETRDSILTGTPAGSSVVQPGDVVKVEVDAPATGH